MLNTLIVIRQCLLKLLIKVIKKYTKILERVSSLMNTELDSKLNKIGLNRAGSYIDSPEW